MKVLGYIIIALVVAVAALEIGGIAYAWLERTDMAEVYPWTLPMTDPAQSPLNYRNAWLVVGAIPFLLGAFIVVLVFMPARSQNHGSARFARPGEMTRQGMFAKSGVILGKNGSSKRARLFRQDEQTHTLLVAPTGAGKGVGVIVPNLLTYGGSVVCVDVKGENWRLTAHARQAMGDEVYRFSPRSTDGRSHCWNPLSYISKDKTRRLSELRQLATFLFPVITASSDSWVKGARNIFVGVCLYVLDHKKEGERTIGSVYRSINGGDGFAKSMKAILDTDNLDPECGRLIGQYLGYAEDQLSGYVGSLEPLNLWSDPLVDAATSSDSFDLHDIRRVAMSIYLDVKPGEIEELAPLIRLFFQQVMGVMQESEPGEDEPYPVLLLMDEFRTLGKLETILSAITTIRGFGGRFLIVVQGLSNLAEVYGREGRDNIVQNCGFQIFYTMSDQTSAEYVSKRLGRTTVKQTSKSFGAGRTPTRSYSEGGKDLMSVDEMGRLDAKRSILIVEGGWPVKAWKIKYYDEDRFVSLMGTAPSPPPLKRNEEATAETQKRPVAPTAETKAASGTDGSDKQGGSASVDRRRKSAKLLTQREGKLEQAEAVKSEEPADETKASDPEDDGNASNEIQRPVDGTDASENVDSRFKVRSDVNMFEEADRVFRENDFPHVADRVKSISDDLSKALRI